MGVTVIIGGQAGSEGKGKVAGYLSDNCAYDAIATNQMSNSGHTYIDDKGNKRVLRQLPVGLINSKEALIVLDAGAVITPEVLFEDIFNNIDVIGDRVINIHPNAAVVSQKYIEAEKEMNKSGSTFCGAGIANAAKAMRKHMPFAQYWHQLQETGKAYKELCDKIGFDDIVSKVRVVDTSGLLQGIIDMGGSVLLETGQGVDLDNNYGIEIPYVTSRSCSVAKAFDDAGISPVHMDDVVMVIRPYPIRISNTTAECGEIYSGGYGSSIELTWNDVARRCGAPAGINFEEYTTVPNKVRRVFEFNMEQLKKQVKRNTPTYLCLNFAQYIDWNVLGCRREEDLLATVMAFIDNLEKELHVRVGLVGTGEKLNDMVFRL